LGNRTLPAEEPNAAVSVCVYNYAKVPQRFLDSAEREASGIFTAAGIHTVWADCLAPGVGVQLVSIPPQPARWTEPDGQGAARGITLELRILGPSAIRRGRFSENMVGFATGSDLASIYYERVEELAWGVDKDETHSPLVLGDIMAHELGHLLLGTNSHSPSGIMCANWNREFLRQALMGHQLFSPKQSAMIRAEVLRRRREAVQR